MTDRYWNKTGNNTDGLSEATAYNTFSAVHADCVDGDRVLVGAGVYSASEMQTGSNGYALVQTGITIEAQVAGSVTVQPSSTTAAFRWSTNLSGQTVGVSGIVMDDSGTAVPNYGVWVANNGASACTVVCENNTFKNNVIFGIYVSNSLTKANITVKGNTLTGVSTRGLIKAITLGEGDVLIENNTITITGKTNGESPIYLSAGAAACTAIVRNNNITCTLSSSVSQIEHPMIRVLNIDGALIESNNVNCYADSTTGTGSLIVVDCDIATLTANNCIVRNNTGYIDTTGGFMIRFGHDGSDAALDHKANNGTMTNNTVDGSEVFRNSTGHSIFFGHQTDCNSSFNIVSNGGLGLLCKGTIGGGHYANIIRNFGSTAANVGSGIQAKGVTNTTFYGNILEVTPDCSGSVLLVIADDTQSPTKNSTGALIQSNAIQISDATKSTLGLIQVSENSTATFASNTYANADDFTKATPCTKDAGGAGQTSVSLASWKSTDETSANIDNTITSVITSGSGSSPSRAVTYIASQATAATSSAFTVQPSQELEIFAAPRLGADEFVTIEVNDVSLGWRTMGIVINSDDTSGFIVNNKRVAQEYRVTKSATQVATRIESN
tara:strand:- start:1926 stop:3755 length:1830 start_codon:yes stop_codon:yes gene_type:complete